MQRPPQVGRTKVLQQRARGESAGQLSELPTVADTGRLIPLPSSPNLHGFLSFFPSFRPALASGAQVFHDSQRL
jgi:hypothetical protein